MFLQELIGKKITNIFQLLDHEPYGMDKGEFFIELDNKLIIEIPYSFSENVWVKELDEKAISIFTDLLDYPVYHVNKKKKSIEDVVEKYSDKKTSFLEKIRQLLSRYSSNKPQKHIEEYAPYEN
jgi:hypothetical protein